MYSEDEVYKSLSVLDFDFPLSRYVSMICTYVYVDMYGGLAALNCYENGKYVQEIHTCMFTLCACIGVLRRRGAKVFAGS
jgi:hypothetical protein